MNRFGITFARLREERACGLFPYLMAGYPDVETSERLAEVALEVGADGFEIGVPFSDPLADGATLQRVNARALESGASLETALDLVRAIRRRSAETPIALMSYYNPLRQRGEAQLAADLASAGADGAIVPDLPPEEAQSFSTALGAHELAYVPFLAPTSPAERIRAVAALDPAFIYCVALVGVTGARQDLSTTVGEFMSRIREATTAPLVVGFGISQPQHAERVAELGASGVIVASALADLIERSEGDPVPAAREYLLAMKNAARASATRSTAA